MLKTMACPKAGTVNKENVVCLEDEVFLSRL